MTDSAAAASSTAVTLDACWHLRGPFFHGTRVALQVGDELVPGRQSNYHQGRVMNHIYFTALLDTAVWGAELAAALGDGDGRGYVYEVQPSGPFEDDPNVTNKRFSGNPTQSYRSRHPLRVVCQLHDWQGHDRETLAAMLTSLRLMREQGRDVIED
jgi:rifampin ADP-ribosylating transferase